MNPKLPTDKRIDFIDEEIKRRTERGKKLAKRFNDFPAGMSYGKFLDRCADEGLELDFVTSSEMYNEYNKK